MPPPYERRADTPRHSDYADATLLPALLLIQMLQRYAMPIRLICLSRFAFFAWRRNTARRWRYAIDAADMEYARAMLRVVTIRWRYAFVR